VTRAAILRHWPGVATRTAPRSRSNRPGREIAGLGRMNKTDADLINGVPPHSMKRMIEAVSRNENAGKLKIQLVTAWKGGVRSDSRVISLDLDGQAFSRKFTVGMDAPPEFLGDDTGPTPQEMLLAAFNACMVAGYAARCALEGIALEKLTVTTEGELDLRGLLGLDAAIRPGYDQIHYVVRIRGRATPEQFQKIHELVLATSPNRWNIANAIKLKSELLIESDQDAS
jgi:uncharacterized OsmC-like protein